ncbi:DNA repair protein RecN [Polymorphobacter sp. PAMC 29334]|uniref:DNA repair protein RecN n=1 Tax=Polymorphobacter sp. PAMC 29334 TaxID=2862331 RepID=UPI001C73E56E|nr:DNA repair protein RecN [Polymorphobacter sp. PAMC 29334]QYE34507.1 DNA repair protein RecN [Polymorphobacter sp. PAMC 29334]
MLTAIDIRDVVLIEALRLDFAAGLSVLTGETGAGKSILLDSLGLALGARGDAGLVRSGAAFASVTASFSVGASHPARALLDDNDLDHEGDIILRRRIAADGGGRAFINDQPVSVALLRELGTRLVEIHGQHDDRGLLNPRGHRDLLDAFGGLTVEVKSVATDYAAWRAAEAALEAAKVALEAGQRDREWLDHALAELTALAPQPGEEAELAEARSSMQKGARLAGDLDAVTTHLLGSDGGLASLRQAARRLDRLAPEHPLLASALESLDRAVIEASEAEDALAAAGLALSFAPEQLDATEARLFELRAQARKHRVDPDALPALAADLAARAAAIDAGELGLTGLTKTTAAAKAQFTKSAGALTAARTATAARLDAAVTGELGPLKLDAARFRTAIAAASEGAGGADAVQFEISTNPGAPFGPLVKIASGGELSRFILALKVALAETGTAGTMIFDEIDRGVGGAVASAIGDRLARLAQTTQVLVVTHSPQVAARGEYQWRIAKSVNGTVTRTGVTPLDADERREEIARMLSGAEVTDEARAQATRLLALA